MKPATFKYPITYASSGGKKVQRIKAQKMLRKLKSYERWIETAPMAVESVRRVYGDPRAFYERFVAELQRLAD